MKKLNFKLPITLVLVLFIVSISLNTEVTNTLAITSQTPSSTPIKLNDLVDASPMIIDNDADFETYSLPGDGSIGDPYRIENLNINTTGDYCLNFGGNTTKHFIIQNCFLKTDTNYAIYIGKYDIIGEGTVEIFNNEIISTGNDGLKLDGVVDGKIHENYIVSFSAGLSLDDSNFTYVHGNTIKAELGMHITNTEGMIISDNDILINDEISVGTDGLKLSGSINGQIMDNYIVDFTGGISLDDSDFTYVHGNKLVADIGVQVTNSQGVTINKNICNETADTGIYIFNSNETIITHNTCSNNDDTGILAEESHDLGISNNILVDNYYGMRIMDSSGSLITNNLFDTSISYGLVMALSTGLNKIYHNAFFDNNLAGSTIQALDDAGDQWYDEVLEEGNFWDDWSGASSSSYTLDGVAGSEDPFPLGFVPEISEFTQGSISIIMIAMFLLVPIVVVIRRRK